MTAMDSDKSTLKIRQTNEFLNMANKRAANWQEKNKKKIQAHTEKKDPTFCDINYMNKSSWLITYIHNKLKLSRHACRFVKLTQTLKSTKCVVHPLVCVCVYALFSVIIILRLFLQSFLFLSLQEVFLYLSLLIFYCWWCCYCMLHAKKNFYSNHSTKDKGKTWIK